MYFETSCVYELAENKQEKGRFKRLKNGNGQYLTIKELASMNMDEALKITGMGYKTLCSIAKYFCKAGIAAVFMKEMEGTVITIRGQFSDESIDLIKAYAKSLNEDNIFFDFESKSVPTYMM